MATISKALRAIEDGQHRGAFLRLAQPTVEQRLDALEEKCAQLSAQVVGFKPAAETLPTHEGVRRIKLAVAKHYRVPVAALDAPTRWEDAVWARHVAMQLCLTLLSLAPLRIGMEFKRSRGLAIHAANAVKDRVQSNPTVGRDYLACRMAVETALEEK